MEHDPQISPCVVTTLLIGKKKYEACVLIRACQTQEGSRLLLNHHRIKYHAWSTEKYCYASGEMQLAPLEYSKGDRSTGEVRTLKDYSYTPECSWLNAWKRRNSCSLLMVWANTSPNTLASKYNITTTQNCIAIKAACFELCMYNSLCLLLQSEKC